MAKFEITHVEPIEDETLKYWVNITIFWQNGGGGSGLVFDQIGMELLLGHFAAKNTNGLVGKFFESKEIDADKAFAALFKQHYPNIKLAPITHHKSKPKKELHLWKIKKVTKDIGGESEFELNDGKIHHRISIVGKPDNPMWDIDCYGNVDITDGALNLLMEYFTVKDSKQLIGKIFRTGIDEPEAALYALLLRLSNPDLI